eukprot:g454.t1
MLSGKDDGDDVVKRVSRDDGRSDNNNNERDSSEDVIRILFRELAETALEEKPRGDTLVTFFLQCLKESENGRSVFSIHGKKQANSAEDNASYHRAWIKPLLEPMLAEALEKKPENVNTFVKSKLTKMSLKSMSSKSLKMRQDVAKRTGQYIIESAPSLSTKSAVLPTQRLPTLLPPGDRILAPGKDSSLELGGKDAAAKKEPPAGFGLKLDMSVGNVKEEESNTLEEGGSERKNRLILNISDASASASRPLKMVHPMSCPPMYLLKQKRKWPVTPMPTALEKGHFVHDEDEVDGEKIKAPPIESRREDLNFLGLSIPSWKQGASGAVTMRASGRCFGRERKSRRDAKDRQRLARSVLLETVESWEVYADVATKTKFYRDARTGTIQDIPPRGVAISEVSMSGIDGFLASRDLPSTIREEEEEEVIERDLESSDGLGATMLTSSSSDDDDDDDDDTETARANVSRELIGPTPLSSSSSEEEEEADGDGEVIEGFA